MKLGNKIILVVISIIGFYAGFLIISDLATISDKISNFNTNFIPLIFLLVTTGMLSLIFTMASITTKCKNLHSC